jgi:hypothetical protein
VLTVSLLVGGPAWGWDNLYSHEALAEAAVTQVNDRSPVPGAYLRDELGLREGLATGLAVQLGFDSTIDDDLNHHGRSRLLYDLNTLFKGPDPIDEPAHKGKVGVELNERCSHGAGFETCFAELSRFPAERWLRLGTFAEDNPNPRSQHHFHDPTRVHAPPDGNHGLDNQREYLLGLDVAAGELATTLRGGGLGRALSGLLFSVLSTFFDLEAGNFDLAGISAVDRALNTTRGERMASSRDPENLFALPDAERYLHRAIGAATVDEREHYLTLHFLALGHVLHLLQDMGSPGHVRNDFLVEHAWADADGFSLEGAPIEVDRRATLPNGSRPIPGPNLLAAAVAAHASGVSRPRAFLEGWIPPDRLAQYSPVIGLPGDAAFAGRDAADYWDVTPFDSPSGDGLAEFVQTHFFSQGTISNSTGALSNGYAQPAVGRCSDADQSVELPERTRLTGEANVDESGAPLSARFLTSSLVPHLAACRMHQHRLASTQSKPDFPWGATIMNESVQRDYIEILWPWVIRYSARFLESYFAPRLEVIPISENEFRLANRTPFALSFDGSAVEIVYDESDPADGLQPRDAIAASCPAGALTLPAAALGEERGAPSTFTCSLPTALPASPRDPGSFWVVVRGRLGARGEVGTPEEYASGQKDFVVAFDRVLPQIAYEGLRITDPGTDAGRRADVYAIDVDLERQVSTADPGPRARNLTGPLRVGLGLVPSEAGALDFGLPNSESHGPRVALMGDLGLGGPRDELEVTPLTEPWLLDLSNADEPLAEIPFGSDQFAGARFRGVVWDRTPGSPLLTFQTYVPGTETTPQEDYIVTRNMDSGADDRQLTLEHVWLESRAGDVLSASRQNQTDFDLVLLDVATREITHRLDLEAGVFEACDPSCSQLGQSDAIYSDFSPNGRTLVFMDLESGELKLIDALRENGTPDSDAQVRPLLGAGSAPVEGAFPVFSPDGRRIAFIRGDDVFVIDAAGGQDPVRLTATNPDRPNAPPDATYKGPLTWMAGLRLSDTN